MAELRATDSAGFKDDVDPTIKLFMKSTEANFFNIAAEFKSMDVQIQSLDESMDTQFQNVAAELKRIDATFKSLDESIDAHFQSIEAEFMSIAAQFENIGAEFKSIDARFDRMDARFDDTDAKTDARFTGIEARLSGIEALLNNQKAISQWSEILPVFRKTNNTKYHTPPSCYPNRVSDYWDLLAPEGHANLLTLITFYFPEDKFEEEEEKDYEHLHCLLAEVIGLDYPAVKNQMEIAQLRDLMKSRRVRKVPDDARSSDVEPKQQKRQDEDHEEAADRWRHPSPTGKTRKQYNQERREAGLLVSEISSEKAPSDISQVNWDYTPLPRGERSKPKSSVSVSTKSQSSGRSRQGLSPTQQLPADVIPNLIKRGKS